MSDVFEFRTNQVPWKCKIVDRYDSAFMGANGLEFRGRAFSDEQCIYIANFGDPIAMAQTFIHELCHVIIAAYSLGEIPKSFDEEMLCDFCAIHNSFISSAYIKFLEYARSQVKEVKS